jgi:hypothetical protein
VVSGVDCKYGSMWGGWFLARIMGRVGLVYEIYHGGGGGGRILQIH